MYNSCCKYCCSRPVQNETFLENLNASVLVIWTLHTITVGQAYWCCVQASAYFKISMVTTTAWCHPTSTVAVKAANTAVCEHRLTPRGSAAPPRSARSGDRPCSPSRACSGNRHERLSSSAAVRHRSASTETRFTTAPKPIMDFTTWLWMFVFEREPSNVSFHSRTVVTRIQSVAEDGFVDHEGCSGLISLFLIPVLCLLVLRY